MSRTITVRRWFNLAAVLAGLTACGGAEQPAAPACTELDGVCVGLPLDAVCASDTCTDGVVCAAVRRW